MNQDLVIELTQYDFNEEVFDADMPVLVDFWADWCSPCKEFSPIFEEVANDYLKKADDGYIMERKVKFCRLNIEENPTIVETLKERGLHVTHIPHIILFSQGGVVGEIEGFSGTAALRQQLIELLKKVA